MTGQSWRRMEVIRLDATMKSYSTTMVFRRVVAFHFGGRMEAEFFLSWGGSAPEKGIIALQPALSLAGYISETSALQTERSNLCPSDPNLRPFDISIDPDFSNTMQHSCNCPFSTVGTDITITHSHPPISIPLMDDVQQKLTAIADRNLQKSEREKYSRDKMDVDTNTPSARTIPGDQI